MHAAVNNLVEIVCFRKDAEDTMISLVKRAYINQYTDAMPHTWIPGPRSRWKWK